MNILYVDDDDDLRDVAELSLRMDPQMDVQVAASGESALEILANGWRPHVILLDVMMPGMDGPTTLTRMRETQLDGGAPVIFVTARALPDEIARLMAQGAVGVITKPFDPLALAAEVRRILAAI